MSRGDALVLLALAVSLAHVEVLGLADELLREARSHQHLVLDEDLEELFSQNRQILLFQQLRVDLRKLVKLRVDLVLGNGALVADQVLQVNDFGLVLLL